MFLDKSAGTMEPLPWTEVAMLRRMGRSMATRRMKSAMRFSACNFWGICGCFLGDVFFFFPNK